MKTSFTRIISFTFLIGFFILDNFASVSAQTIKEKVIDEKLLYHPIHLNLADQTTLPWYSAELGVSYDFVIGKVWDFWITQNGVSDDDSWTWKDLGAGGVLTIKHTTGKDVIILK